MRRLAPLATVPAMTAPPGPFETVRDSPVIIDSSTSADPSTTGPSTGTRVPGRGKDNVVHFQLRDWNGLSLGSAYTFGSVWEQRGECIERAARLGNGSHLQPMAEDHDRDQRRQFPPNLDLEEAECCGD